MDAHQTDTSCKILVSWTRYRRRPSYGGSGISTPVRLGHAASIVDYTTTSARNTADDKGKCTETKSVVNVRIHVERAIGRIKWLHFLKQTMPLTLVPLANEIVTICAVLCNLSPALVTIVQSCVYVAVCIHIWFDSLVTAEDWDMRSVGYLSN